MPETKSITLYLAGWQKRMIMDHVKLERGIEKVSKIKILGKLSKKEWVMYRQPAFEHINQTAWNLYLTDEQINHASEALGIKTKISALNMSKEVLESGAITFE